MEVLPHPRNAGVAGLGHFRTLKKVKNAHRHQLIPRPIGEAALVLFVTLVVFILLGLVWGLIHPTTQLTVAADGGADTVPGTEDASFKALAYFLALTGLGGLAIGLWVFRTRMRSLLMMLWVGVVTLWGSVTCWTVGTWLAEKLHADPLPTDPHPGDLFHLVEATNPGSGMLVGTALALVAYWLAATFVDPEDF